MRFRLVLTGVMMAAAAAGFWFGQAQRGTPEKPPETSAIVLETPRDPGDFRLIDHYGRPFTPVELGGQWTLWFFGFTHCPDVCPMTLATLNLVDGLLAEAGGVRPKVLMVSVDPARDTVAALAAYVPFFNPAFLGVTGDAAQIRVLTERVGIIVQYVAEEGDRYTVNHSASLLLTGPGGLVRAVFRAPHEPNELARELSDLIIWLETQ